jgi:hypothetical protein
LAENARAGGGAATQGKQVRVFLFDEPAPAPLIILCRLDCILKLPAIKLFVILLTCH